MSAVDNSEKYTVEEFKAYIELGGCQWIDFKGATVAMRNVQREQGQGRVQLPLALRCTRLDILKK